MAITRRAILIGAPSVKPELPGVTIDVEDIRKFLCSNKGGAWRQNEVLTLLDPTKMEILKAIREAENIDYVFITCSGHGEHQIGASSLGGQTVMYLNEKETISIESVNPKNKRHLVVVDVCRNLVKITAKLTKALEESLSFKLDSARYVDYRRAFDDAVVNTSEGRIVAYSCDINQSAGDDGNGGVFTQALLDSPTRFSKRANNSYGIVDINQAFEIAKLETYRVNAPQNPVLNAGRRREFFPFAIVV
jgi:hypothetical protein